MNREHLGSRLGFLLLSAGCAIGVGNVWKFPWMVGQNGGGAFVLIYIIFLLILGLPVMTMEFSMGRAAQKSPIHMYQALTPDKKTWGIHGVFCFIGNVVLMMFYTVVAGWLLYYFYSMVTGKFNGMDNEAIGNYFGGMLGNPSILVGYAVAICILGFFVLSFSLKKGLERVTKIMMIALIVIMVIIAINSVLLEGAGRGLSFYLVPDFSKINADVLVAAMNQAFFTLSLGIGAMAIFGSYIDKDRALFGESINVIALDTFVAFVAGIIIFPACFTYDVEPGAGPSLIFITLPNIFMNMKGGRLWGSLFFLFMTFAAFSTVLAVFENILACVRDLTNWSRVKASIICCIAIIILSIPCALGFNVWSNIMPLGEGTGIMDLEDFIVSNCLLPLGSLVYVVYCTNKFGWGWDNFVKEANEGKGLKISNGIYLYCKFILPIIIFIIFALGIKSIFFK
ncbi:MAG: sodium-dependent transporter [Lachnospiraceae bacterium]|nr:sodium-dependent transporter [Lachnospiraceae bacterium]